MAPFTHAWPHDGREGRASAESMVDITGHLMSHKHLDHADLNMDIERVSAKRTALSVVYDDRILDSLAGSRGA